MFPLFRFCLVLSISLTCILPATATESPLPGVPVGVAEIIKFPGSAIDQTKPTLTMLDSNQNELIVEFNLPEIAIQQLAVDGQIFHAIEIAGGAFRGEIGAPMLPTFSKAIQIPDYSGVTIDLETISTTELNGYRPLPMQPADNSSFQFDASAYSLDSHDNTAPVEIGAPVIIRDRRIVPVTINPVQYDPATGKVTVAEMIRIRISFTGEDLRNPTTRFHRIIPVSFHNLYKSLIVNYSGPRSDQVVGLGSYVIICSPGSSVVNRLQPLVEWRTRKGYDVHLATTDETGTTRTSIKSWIQDKYDTWENPPEYIVLIGDTYGDISIPYWTEYISGYDGGGDHPYCQLAGSDDLGDAHLGRISVTSYDELELYINKIVPYESTPYMDSTDWYKRGTVVGDPSDSGYTTIQCMQWVKTQLLNNDYADVDTLFSAPWVSQMIDKLNQGNSVFGYRGFFGMSGVDTGDISNLENGRKMPFAVILTCQTGTFAGSFARSEAFMRAGLPPSIPSGGIAAIGTATGGTHTRFNNCITYGIWRGLLRDNVYQFGASLNCGKYDLYLNYGEHDPANVSVFCHWNNLMGDPAGELWSDIPQPINVSHPALIELGTNTVVVDITDGAGDCQGAYVCLWKGTETHVGGFTDANGHLELPVDIQSTGDLKITVTKRNCHPYLAEIPVQTSELYVGYLEHDLNGDGNANPAESVGLSINVMNYGTIPAPSVTGQITVDDPYVTITDNTESFGTIDAGGSAWCLDNFDFSIAGEAPDGHIINIGLDTYSGLDSWYSLVRIPVIAAKFTYQDISLYDVSTRLDPGESGELSVEIRNTGSVNALAVTATVSTNSTWLTFTDDTGAWGDILVNSNSANDTDRFGVAVSAGCYQGHIADCQLVFEFSSGVIDTLDFSLTIGEQSASDPTGPDAYGYYAYDNTDTAYLDAPTYNWVEIAANHGGPGVSVGLTDFGTAQDDSRTLNLPFLFTYYGVTFSRATICSNGWLAMGSTPLTNYRNWEIPCAGAPPYMIAPMWDNFYQSGDDQVYHWFDEVNHRYIIQWSRLQNVYPEESTPISNFQVILYDPAYVVTDTGDGRIVFQYETFNDSDSIQMYSTCGIQNGDNTIGVSYNYWDTPSPGSAPIVSGRAIAFQPLSIYPTGVIDGSVTNASYNNVNLPGASVSFVECGQAFISNSDGYFGGLVPEGTYTVVVTRSGFDTVTLLDVSVIEGETTDLDIGMTDNAGPEFLNTTEIESTADPIGPYDIYSTITEYSGVDELLLYYMDADYHWESVDLIHQGENLYHASIPGAPFMTNVKYYLYGRDSNGFESTDPIGGAGAPYTFWVLDAMISEDMEDGSSGWTHDHGPNSSRDEWHLSTSRNHTPGGNTSWKSGDNGSEGYRSRVDGILTSPSFDIDGDATLTFWHWMDAEEFPYDPEMASDGGIVQLSIDGGIWIQIEPEGGYPFLCAGMMNSPFDEGTPIYSGYFDWSEAVFILEDLHGSARIRFRFGSDRWTQGEFEGWYIDDVYLLPDTPGISDAPAINLFPETVMLYQNQPNPFGSAYSTTSISFDLPAESAVSLKIYDANGRLIRTLAQQVLEAGRHVSSWDGTDTNNHQVGSGLYFYVLEADGRNSTRRMLIMK